MGKRKRHSPPRDPALGVGSGAPTQALVLADIPERNRLRELQRLLNERRDHIAELDLEIETVRDALIAFESHYRARVAAENAQLLRIEQLVQHFERWADLLHEASSSAIATQAQRLETRRTRELGKTTARQDLVTAVAETAPAVRSPDERLKLAYRALARRFHPDLASTEADRVQYGDMMARINALYHDGDLERLEALAEQAKGGDIDDTERDLDAQVALLEERLRWFDMVVVNLREERGALERTPTCELMRDVAQAAATGRDLIAEVKTEMGERVDKSYAHVANTAHVLESEVESFNRRNATEVALTKRQSEALERRFDPFADKRIIRLGLEELRDLHVRPEARALAEQIEGQAEPQRSLLRLLLLTYVAELSPFPLPGLESYDDVNMRFACLGEHDDTTTSLEKTLVAADSFVEFGVKRPSEKIVRMGLRFRSELVREAVPVLLKAMPIRREFKRVLGVLGERELCPGCDHEIFAVPLFRTHGLDDLRALVCPRCSHTLRSYWMPKGKDVQAVLNAAFLDFEIISEWSFQLGRGSFGTQLLPLQVETMRVGDLRRRIFEDVFKRYELELELDSVQFSQDGIALADERALAEITETTFVIRFAEGVKVREAEALEMLRHRVRNRFRA